MSSNTGPVTLEVICTPAKEALPDRTSFIHPALGPGYLCRVVAR